MSLAWIGCACKADEIFVIFETLICPLQISHLTYNCFVFEIIEVSCFSQLRKIVIVNFFMTLYETMTITIVGITTKQILTKNERIFFFC